MEPMFKTTLSVGKQERVMGISEDGSRIWADGALVEPGSKEDLGYRYMLKTLPQTHKIDLYGNQLYKGEATTLRALLTPPIDDASDLVKKQLAGLAGKPLAGSPEFEELVLSRWTEKKDALIAAQKDHEAFVKGVGEQTSYNISGVDYNKWPPRIRGLYDPIKTKMEKAQGGVNDFIGQHPGIDALEPGASSMARGWFGLPGGLTMRTKPTHMAAGQGLPPAVSPATQTGAYEPRLLPEDYIANSPTIGSGLKEKISKPEPVE